MIYENIARNILIFDELVKLLKVFNEKGLDVILLKGVSLLKESKESFAARTMEDIDILVRKQDIPSVISLMSEISYEQKTSGEYVFHKEESITCIDVHDGIWYLADDEMENVWSKAREIVFGGVNAKILSHEDSIVFIIAHSACHHCDIKDMWLSDIKRIMNDHELDIIYLLGLVKKYNLRIPAGYIFNKLNLQFNGLKISKLKLKIFEFLISIKIEGLGHFFRPFVVSGFKKRLKFLLNFLFPSLEFIQRRYNVSKPFDLLLLFLRPALLLYSCLEMQKIQKIQKVQKVWGRF